MAGLGFVCLHLRVLDPVTLTASKTNITASSVGCNLFCPKPQMHIPKEDAPALAVELNICSQCVAVQLRRARTALQPRGGNSKDGAPAPRREHSVRSCCRKRTQSAGIASGISCASSMCAGLTPSRTPTLTLSGPPVSPIQNTRVSYRT